MYQHKLSSDEHIVHIIFSCAEIVYMQGLVYAFRSYVSIETKDLSSHRRQIVLFYWVGSVGYSFVRIGLGGFLNILKKDETHLVFPIKRFCNQTKSN